jgi:hypothetical protein
MLYSAKSATYHADVWDAVEGLCEELFPDAFEERE